MARLNYNANEHGDMRDDFAPLPKGRYQAIIEATKLGEPRGEKHTQQLEVTWTVVGGEFNGRKVTNWIAVACDTAVAKDIGMRQIKNICEAVGLAGFTDTDELCGREHVIDVGELKKQKDGKEVVYAEVKRCYPSNAPATATQTAQARPQASAPANTTAPQQAQPAASTPPPSASVPPWARR